MDKDMLSRRKLLTSGVALAGGTMLLGRAGLVQADVPNSTRPRDGSAETTRGPAAGPTPLPPGESRQDYTPVVTPNGGTLPWKVVDGFKVFHLTAEEFNHEFAPGLAATCWGYNGQTPGPTIEAVEGDRVRFYVTNKLKEATSLHWHGILLPNGMDGVAGLNQKRIEPGETFKYEFTLRQHGTMMYHPHFDEMTQMGLGMMGMFVVHPREPEGPKIDRDFAIMLSEWRIDPGTSRPNPIEMTDFNVLTMNSRHGYQFRITETDGGRIPEAGQWPETTVLVPVGTTRTIEFVADEPGDWAFHCHMTHHVMNQMGHNIPNLIGVKPGDLDEKIGRLLPSYMTMGETGMGGMGEMGMGAPKNSIPMVGGEGPFAYIDMGGMFTVLKVRDGITSYDNPGWYRHPAETVAAVASADELRRDGIDLKGKISRQ